MRWILNVPYQCYKYINKNRCKPRAGVLNWWKDAKFSVSSWVYTNGCSNNPRNELVNVWSNLHFSVFPSPLLLFPPWRSNFYKKRSHPAAFECFPLIRNRGIGVVFTLRLIIAVKVHNGDAKWHRASYLTCWMLAELLFLELELMAVFVFMHLAFK